MDTGQANQLVELRLTLTTSRRTLGPSKPSTASLRLFHGEAGIRQSSDISTIRRPACTCGSARYRPI